MKNKQIIRAYDAVNPTEDQKKKMLEAILKESGMEEAPAQKETPARRETPVRKKREPVVYTGTPTKTSKRSVFGMIAASIAILLVSGLVLFRLAARSEDPAYTDPQPSETQNGTITVSFAYSDLLNKYRTALAEGWSKEQCQIEGISTRFYMPEPIEFTVGQRMLDLNNDGKGELLIGHDDHVWDLYTTLEDGTPIQLLSDEQDGWQYYVCEDQRILCEYFSKEDCFVEYYRLEGHTLQMDQQLEYVNGQWKMQSAGNDWVSMTEREAQDLMDSVKKRTPDWIPLTPVIDTDALEHYMLTLEKYKTALTEKWSASECRTAGISDLTVYTALDTAIGWQLQDIDGNGVQELIISDGGSLLDVYTLNGGEVEHPICAEENLNYTLCENGVVQRMVITPAETWWYFADFSDFFVDQVLHIKDHQYSAGIGESYLTPITEGEAGEILFSYGREELNLTWLTPAIHYDQQEYDYLIYKYQQAIQEGWSKEHCEQNDISPRIMNDINIRSRLGWCLLDMDGDGKQELIISDGTYLYDLYVEAPNDGGFGHLVMANSDPYSLRRNGVIVKEVSFSKGKSYEFYEYANGEMTLKNVLTYRNEYTGTTATERWYWGTDGDNGSEISRERAMDILADYPNQSLDLTSFTKWHESIDARMQYEKLLSTYRQAIFEKWNPGQCVEQGISLMVGYYGDFVTDLGYALMDLDGNSIEELIITDGTNIYDLYTVGEDRPVQVFTAMERLNYYLSPEGNIYFMGSGGAARSNYVMYALEEKELRYLEGFAFDADTDPDNPWFYYDGEEIGAPCDTGTATKAIDTYYKIESIPFTPFE